ncbi:MAG: polyphosphate kinase 2 [Saprospiraceae bacterium]|nr:polyphosphate kinase 2 [Saprospiraceae bacterium]MCB9344294.1 polyphosphate kinase 2 [Lewinellaceae bacterium]
MLTLEDFSLVKKRRDLIKIAAERNICLKKVLRNLRYEEDLKLLQAEMVDLQQWIAKNNKRVAVIFEGRDAAGKGGAIKRFREHLNPRSMRVVALSKPTIVEQGQWYFRRYIKELPNPGEIVFFDRSWYNRAVVEPVMGFCDKQQYRQFMAQVTDFEHMLREDGIGLIKFWFSISKEEQKNRFEARLQNPLKQWKFSPVDMKGQELWNKYTQYKERMFAQTHTNFSPWIIVQANNKRVARLESMRYVLSQFDYKTRREPRVTITPDPNIISRYFRDLEQIDI